MERDVVLSPLNEFQIQEFAVVIELGDESVVVGSLRLAVHARNEIVLLDGIVDEAIGGLQFRHGDLSIERASDDKRDHPDKPRRWMCDGACQKGYHGGGSAPKVDGC
jgi:hypothetical protein